MRYDHQANYVLILMAVGYLHERRQKITADTVHLAIGGYLASHRVSRYMKQLTDMGAIIWAERPRGSRAGEVLCIRPKQLPPNIKISRTSLSREINRAISLGLIYKQGDDWFIDAEMVMSDDLMAFARSLKPDVTEEEVYSAIRGKVFKVA